MEGLTTIRNELREKFNASVRSSESEERFIEYLNLTLSKTNNCDIRALEVILDLALIVVDQSGNFQQDSQNDPNRKKATNDEEDEEEKEFKIPDSSFYDADDEGSDEVFVFPCHLIFDDCHPELLLDYHREHLKNTRTSTQIIKHPRLCEFVVNYMFKSLREQLKTSKTNEHEDIANKGSLTQDSDVDLTLIKSLPKILDTCHPCLSDKLKKYMNSVAVLIKRLNKICIQEKKNCRILSRTNILFIVLENILFMVQEIPNEQQRYLEPLLRFVFTLADYKITAENLKQIFALIKNEETDLKTVLSNFESLLNHQYKILKNIQPAKSINFPTASRTAEEIESNSYVINSWHWRVRSKVIESKRKRSRALSSNSVEFKSEQGVSDNVSPKKQVISNEISPKTETKITPSWLECSMMAPLSNISPLMHEGQVKFCCSMWMSVCGDLLVIDNNRNKKSSDNQENLKIDWRVTNGHWLRLTSRKRLARRYGEKVVKHSARVRRLSVKLKKRIAEDKEDEENEENYEKSKRDEIEMNQVTNINGHRIKLSYPIGSRAGLTNLKQHKDLSSPNKKPSMVDDLKDKQQQQQQQKPPKGFLGRRARDNSQELLIHLISFAMDTFTIEIWLNVKSMTFCARACRITREGQTNLIDQVTFPSHLEANGSWSHVVFSLEEIDKSSSEKMMYLKVIVNGLHKEKEKLIYGSHKSPLTNFACLVGCERSTFGYVWKLSQINIYKNTPPKDIPIYLLGKGPDFWSFTNFRSNSTFPLPDITQRSIKILMNPRMLSLYSTVDEEKALNWLTQNIVISYVAHQADYFLDYSSSSVHGSIIHPLPADHEFSNSSERFIQAKVLNYSRSLKFNTNYGFGSALVEAGGIESMMICFADVIRRAEDSAEVQALSLSILLKMSLTNQHHLNKFLDELNGLKLIEFILAHPNCLVTKPMLESYLDFCLVRKGEHNIIKSPKLLYHILTCWRAWHKDVRIARLLYRKLKRLLQPIESVRRADTIDIVLENYYIEHNFAMINNAGGIDILMGILRESLVPLDDSVPKINHELVELIVDLISLSIKHPPSLEVILDIMEFLLFLHPDPKAYVEATASKTSFLYTIHADQNNEEQTYDRLNHDRTPLSETDSSYRDMYGDEKYVGNQTSLESNFRSRSEASLSRSNDEDSCSLRDCEDEFYIEENREYSYKFHAGGTQNNQDSMMVDEQLINVHDIDMDLNQMNILKHGRHKAGDLPEIHKCSNRNYAIANIADMLASIVKLTLTDPGKILSDALQKPIIDARKLIILANNNSFLVREKVLRLFLYCMRAIYSLNLKSILSKYEQDFKNATNFKTCVPIQLMGSQLLKYPTTAKMIQLCYGIIVGIEDFETVETVCLVFDIETVNNNLQMNTLVLLTQLMTKLQEPKVTVSAVKFIYTYIKKLLQLGKDNVVSILVKNDLVENLMRIYFSYIEHKVNLSRHNNNYNNNNNSNNNTHELSEESFKDDYDEVSQQLDKTLILIVRYFTENMTTEEAIKSIEDLLNQFDLINSYVPKNFKYIMRERKAKILTILINYCNYYEMCAREQSCTGKMEYYFKSIFTKSIFTNSVYSFPNVLSSSHMNMSQVLEVRLPTEAVEIHDQMQVENSKDQSMESKTNNEHLEAGNIEQLKDIENSDNSEIVDADMPDKKISETNVLDRFKATIRLSLGYIITREPGVIPSELERRFITNYLKLLRRHLHEYRLLTTNKINSKCNWYLMLPKLEKLMRASFSQLVLYLLSPCDSMNLDERKFSAKTILDMFDSVKELIQLLEEDSTKTTYRVLVVFIKDLIDYNDSSYNLENSSNDIDEDSMDDDIEFKLKLLAKNLNIHLNSSDQKPNSYFEKHKKAKISNDKFSELDTKFRDIWLADLAQAREDARERVNMQVQAVSNSSPSENAEYLEIIFEEALKITRDVVNDKHEQRKIYLEDLKQNKVYNYHVRQQWLSLIIGHTHERAIWFMKSHYPSSWELNPVEGPSRIRRRLRPCKLALDKRYMRDQNKSDNSRQNSKSKSHYKNDLLYQSMGSSIDNLNKFTSQSSHSDELAPNDDWYNQYSPHPLCSMIINNEQSMDSNELRIRMFTTDKIHFNCDCSIIRPNEVCEGEVSVASWCIHFIGERSDSYQRHLRERVSLNEPQPSRQTNQVTNVTVDDSGYEGRVNSTATANEPIQMTTNNNKKTTTSGSVNYKKDNFTSVVVEDLWFDEIVEIWDRRYQLQDVGLEIFLTNNMTYLISFRNNRDREDFKQSLMREKHKMINLQLFNLNNSLNRLSQLWRDGRITNFDYLTCLNKLAGRSFNDLMQYPVFPFILSNYTSNILDLTDSNNFRKLDRPMAVQNVEKEETFVKNYQDSQSTNLSIGLFGMTKPYHYGNHYSNSATVLHFLVRLPPFTQMLIQYQDNNFDQPDRTFHSIASTWQLITQDSNTDFKELIPEFYFLPEMFLNIEQFELGRKQNNELVDDVLMPPWCPNYDARLFTLILRQALESSYVSEKLHHWIDLIFGYKQTGKAAIEAINVFHPATYYGVIDLNNQPTSSSSSIRLSSTTHHSTSAKSSTYSSDYNASDIDFQGNNKSTIGLNAEDTESSKNTLMIHKRQQVDIERLALETMIKTYGQMPRQLFAQPTRQRSLATYAPQIQYTSQQQESGPRRIEPLRQVIGLKWGSYVGSPDESDIIAARYKRIIPEETHKSNSEKNFRYRNFNRPTIKFVVCLLPNGDVAILKSNTNLMLDYRADRKSFGGYQLSLPLVKYSRRAGLSSVARMNLFSNMIISRQQFSYIEPTYLSSNQFDSMSNQSTSSLVSLTTSSKAKFTHDSLSLISWSYLDGIIRIRHPGLNNQKSSVPLVQADSMVDTMSTCASVPELNLLLVGYKSGSICAHIVSTSHEAVPIAQYIPTISSGAASAAALLSNSAAPSAVHFLNTKTSSSSSDIAPLGPGKVTNTSRSGQTYNAVSLAGKTLQSARTISKTSRWLYCHSKRINCIKINVSFGIVVTGSDDGTSVIWDLNSLNYVRTINYKLNSMRKKSSTNHERSTNGDQQNSTKSNVSLDEIRSSNLNSWINSQLDNSRLMDYLCNCDHDTSLTTNASQQNQYEAYKYSDLNLADATQSCICGSGINLIAISDTLGDIVTVKDISNRLAVAADCAWKTDDSQNNLSTTSSTSSEQSESSVSSIVYVHTINGSLVGFVNCHSQVTAVCYSNAPEGISINVIVVGLADGLIRLYSSWDFSRVKEFHVAGISLPITSLLYTRDSQLLYVVYEDGQLVVLRNKNKSITSPKEWLP